MGKATDFSKHKNMPMTGKQPNIWFSSTISKLPNLMFKNNGLVVELSLHNARIINNEIKKDNRYDRKLMSNLFKLFGGKHNRQSIMYDREMIMYLILMVDLENSTNVDRFQEPKIIKKMASYICNKRIRFWDKLRDRDITIVGKLSRANKSQSLLSLASKVCQTFSIIFYNRDNYYKYDRVVRHVLPYYLNFYGIKLGPDDPKTKTDFDNITYDTYSRLLDELRKTADPKLSRKDMDRIMWYSYRYQSQKENEENE